MGLHLIDCRRHFREMAEIQISVRIEIRNPEGSHLPSPVRLFHRTVRSIVIAERLMDQKKVDVVGFQFSDGLVDGSLCLLISCIADPHLGGQKQLFPLQATVCHSASHALLIVVCLGGIDAAVSHLNGFADTALRFFRRGLIDSVT